MNGHFTEKEIQVINKHIQLHLVSLIRKVKIKTTRGINFTPQKCKSLVPPSVSEEVKQVVAPAGVSVSWCCHTWEPLNNVQHSEDTQPCSPSHSLGSHHREMPAQ